MQVGAGVKDATEGQWVLPLKSHVGCWRGLAVWKARDVLKVRKPPRALSAARHKRAVAACGWVAMNAAHPLEHFL